MLFFNFLWYGMKILLTFWNFRDAQHPQHPWTASHRYVGTYYTYLLVIHIGLCFFALNREQPHWFLFINYNCNWYLVFSNTCYCPSLSINKFQVRIQKKVCNCNESEKLPSFFCFLFGAMRVGVKGLKRGGFEMKGAKVRMRSNGNGNKYP